LGTAPRPQAEGARWPALVIATVAVSALGAGAVHAATIKTTGSTSGLYLAFFLGVAAAQVGWSALVAVRPSRALFVLGAVGNGAVLATWVLSRTAGVPVGPSSGAPLPVGFPDALTAALEALIVAGAILLALRPDPSPERPPLAGTAVMAVVILSWSVLAVLVQLGAVTISSLPASV